MPPARPGHSWRSPGLLTLRQCGCPAGCCPVDPLPQCPCGTMPRSRVSAAPGVQGTAGIQKARPVSAPVGRPVRPAHADLGRLTSADNPAGLLVPAGCRSRRGRPQRPGLAGSSAALSAAGCGPVRLRPTGVRSAAGLWPGVRTAVSAADMGVDCGCPPLEEAVAGRRPLVGCSQRRQARHTCRPGCSPSWPRTFRADLGRLPGQPVGPRAGELLGELPSTRHEPLPLGVVHYRSLFEELIEVGPGGTMSERYGSRYGEEPGWGAALGAGYCR